MLHILFPILAVAGLGVLTFRAIKHERERIREEEERRNQEFAALPERVDLALAKTSISTVNYQYGRPWWGHLIKIGFPLLGVIGLQWILGDIDTGISINGIDFSPGATKIFLNILMSAMFLFAGLDFVEACNQIGRRNVIGIDPVAIEFPYGWPVKWRTRIPFSEITNLSESGEYDRDRGVNRNDLLIHTVEKTYRLNREFFESEVIFHELRKLLEAKISRLEGQAS